MRSKARLVEPVGQLGGQRARHGRRRRERRAQHRDLLQRALAAHPARGGGVEAARAGIAGERAGDLDGVVGEVLGQARPRAGRRSAPRRRGTPAPAPRRGRGCASSRPAPRRRRGSPAAPRSPPRPRRRRASTSCTRAAEASRCVPGPGADSGWSAPGALGCGPVRPRRARRSARPRSSGTRARASRRGRRGKRRSAAGAGSSVDRHGGPGAGVQHAVDGHRWQRERRARPDLT